MPAPRRGCPTKYHAARDDAPIRGLRLTRLDCVWHLGERYAQSLAGVRDRSTRRGGVITLMHLATAVLVLVAMRGLEAQTAGVPASVDTIAPESVTELPYTFNSDGLTLSGTIALPGDTTAPFPIVVIIAGSGPTDRNGNAPTGTLRSNLYAQLAWRLAERGVATLRYDKRVLPATQGNVDVVALTLDDLAHDVSAAVVSLRGDERFTTTVLVGHGEGATLAIRAMRLGLEADGLVLAAAAGRPMRVILREQLRRQVDEALLARFDNAMDRYLRGDPVGDIPSALEPLFVAVNRVFMRSAISISPSDELAALNVPVLIVQGDTDLQMSPRDARSLQAVRPDARVVIVRSANHVFKRVADTTLAAQLPTYTNPRLPVVPELVDAIVEFVEGMRRQPL